MIWKSKRRSLVATDPNPLDPHLQIRFRLRRSRWSLVSLEIDQFRKLVLLFRRRVVRILPSPGKHLIKRQASLEAFEWGHHRKGGLSFLCRLSVLEPLPFSIGSILFSVFPTTSQSIVGQTDLLPIQSQQTASLPRPSGCVLPTPSHQLIVREQDTRTISTGPVDEISDLTDSVADLTEQISELSAEFSRI